MKTTIIYADDLDELSRHINNFPKYRGKIKSIIHIDDSEYVISALVELEVNE